MPVTIRECPHCYTRVAFKDDGLCPACAKNLAEPGADPSRTLFSASEGAQLPDICISCGSATNRRVTISQRSYSRAASALRLIWTFFVYIFGLVFHPLLRLLPGEDLKLRVRVSIPLCQPCQRVHGLPKPQRVDYQKGTISFVASRTIVREMARSAEPDPAPNGGPAIVLANSGSFMGPPSVS